MSLARIPPAAPADGKRPHRGASRAVMDAPMSPAAMGSHPIGADTPEGSQQVTEEAEGMREGSADCRDSADSGMGARAPKQGRGGRAEDMYSGPYGVPESGAKAGALQRLRRAASQRGVGRDGEGAAEGAKEGIRQTLGEMNRAAGDGAGWGGVLRPPMRGTGSRRSPRV